MAIDVTCPACHTRFQVSEKFAGKSGPCPKCKKTIKVPELKEQVVIHAPEVSGPVDSKGVAVLKPIARTEVRLSVPMIALIVGSVLGVLIAAFVLRVAYPGGTTPAVITILGAILLGPPLAFAGYTVLRDDELEPYRGTEVLLRSLACGLVFAAIWGAYWLVFAYLEQTPNWQIMAVVVPVMLGIGALASQASYEFELPTGALHYSLYLISTILLRFILGLDILWNVTT
jgi:hypothetical protein